MKISVSFWFFSSITLGILLRPELIFTVFTAVFVHELGHLIAIYALGGEVSNIYFHGCGIKIIPRHDKMLSFWRDIVILLAGSSFNILLTIVLKLVDNSAFSALIDTNLTLAVFNLLPLSTLDGGELALKLAENAWGGENTKNFQHTFEKMLKVFSALFFCALLFASIALRVWNLSLFFLFLYIIGTNLLAKKPRESSLDRYFSNNTQ